MNASPKYFREQAAAHRATAAEDPDDPRYPQSAEALEARAAYADTAKPDAAHHIGSNEGGFDRDDAPELAKSYGLAVDRVHGTLDAGRGIRHVFSVGIPSWHEVGPEVRAELEAMDGVMEPGKRAIYGPADRQERARRRRAPGARLIAQIGGIEVDALGASPYSSASSSARSAAMTAPFRALAPRGCASRSQRCIAP